MCSELGLVAVTCSLSYVSPTTFLVTFSHILVYTSIPPCCILGFLSKVEFEEFCQRRGILSLSPAYPDFEMKIQRRELSLRPETRFGQPMYYKVLKRPPVSSINMQLTPSESQKTLKTEECKSERISDVIDETTRTLSGFSIL